ncbi:WG repeat-containing protein [Cetobacterium sp.]|uniref:WG repeat-containing protein n=1 Tax=Cetobacterium sp. TaxID=2071632 RepID=UPI003F37BEFD
MKKKLGIALFIAVMIVIFQRSYKTTKSGKEINQYSKKFLNIDSGSRLEKNFLIFKLNNKYGIMTQDGSIIKKNEYNQIINLDEKMYLLLTDKGLFAYNIEGNKEFKLEGMSIIGENLYKILKNNKYGIVDSEFNTIVEPVNNRIENKNDRILIINEDKLEVLNRNENMKIKEIRNSFQEVTVGVGNTIYFKTDDKWGILENNGEILIDSKYDRFVNLNDENLVIGYIKNETYLINLEKKIEKRIDYDNYSKESESTIMVMKNNKIGYINDSGEEIVPLKYDGGFYFSKNRDFIQLKENEEWKLLNTVTLEEKKLPYTDIGEFVEGYMVAEKNQKYGYIDGNGEEKIPFKYTIAENFKEGIGIVASPNGYGAIDKNGVEIIPLIYDEVYVNKGYIYVTKDKKIGIFNKGGKEIIPIEYDNLSIVENERVLFEKDGKLGIIKMKGDENGN